MPGPPRDEFAKLVSEELRDALDIGRINLKNFERLFAKFERKQELKFLRRFYDKLGTNESLLISFKQIFMMFIETIKRPIFKSRLTPPLARQIVHEIVAEMFNEVVCAQCHGSKISKHTFHLNREHSVYFCQDCGVNVRVLNRYDYLPLVLIYFQRVFESQRKGKQGKSAKQGKQARRSEFDPVEFVKKITFDALNLLQDIPDIQSIITLNDFCRVNGFEFVDGPALKRKIVEGMAYAIKFARVDLYRRGKEFLEIHFPGHIIDKERIRAVLLDKVVEFLGEGFTTKVNKMLEFGFQEGTLDENDIVGNEMIEEAIYRGLSWCIHGGKIGRFEQLVAFAYDHEFIVEVLKIPERLEAITKLVVDSIHLQRIENIFEYIRFGTKYDLFYRQLTGSERELARRVKKNELYSANLEDLFGAVPDSLVVFLFQDLPYQLYKKFLEQNHLFNINSSIGSLGIQFRNLLDNYTMYGLSIRKIGTVEGFLQEYEKVRRDVEEARKGGKMAGDFVTFTIGKKKHLVSIKSVERIKSRLLARPKKYEFLNVSMVLRSGLGPQGKGFTYSTPFGATGELVEICSDAEENKAYIIKFKHFLKHAFLEKLRDELDTLQITKSVQQEVIQFFDSHIVTGQKVNPAEVSKITGELSSYLERVVHHDRENTSEQVRALVRDIEQVVNRLLVPITMEDQFKVRMELVSKGQISSAEVAKLTSLREKSHYDILRERFFFQVLVETFIKSFDVQEYTAGLLT
ncbi:MAG: hypothetical protein ACTSU5_15155 [Promethearchaeota archaeon]